MMGGAESQKVRIPIHDRSIETKRKIREAGELLFSQKGYHHTNTKEISKHAGVAIGSFYAYYKDKGELFSAIVEAYYLQIFKEMKHVGDYSLSMQKDVRLVVGEMITGLYKAHTIEAGLHREISVILLESRSPRAENSPDGELYRLVKTYVDALDAQVIAWVQQMLGRFFPQLQEQKITYAANLIVNTCEHTIHTLRMSGSSDEENAPILSELTCMIEAYVSSIINELQ